MSLVEYKFYGYIVRKIRDAPKKYVVYDSDDVKQFHFNGNLDDVVIALNAKISDSVVDMIINFVCSQEGIKRRISDDYNGDKCDCE